MKATKNGVVGTEIPVVAQVPAKASAAGRAAVPAVSELEVSMAHALQRLRTLRDEIRVDLHLAGLDAKDRWHELEPVVADAEALARDVGETSVKAVRDIVVRVRTFREQLRAEAAARGR